MANTTFSRGSKVSKEWLQEVNDHIHSDTPVSGNTVHGSNVVSFVQSGSVITRSVAEKLQDFHTPKDFGEDDTGVNFKIRAGGDTETVNITLGHANNSIEDGDANTISGGGNGANPNQITGDSDYRTIAGGYDNQIAGNIASTISGGAHHRISGAATHATVSGGSFNDIDAGDYGTIGGGTSNTVSASEATIAGGTSNTVSGRYGTVGGGSTNTVASQGGTVTGGALNDIGAASNHATIVGGTNNDITNGTAATIVGGDQNKITAGTANHGNFSFIGGGHSNTIGASFQAQYAAILGGRSNSLFGDYSAILGGRENEVTAAYSIAHGQEAKTTLIGQHAHAAGHFLTAGDAQTSVLVAKIQTTDSTPTELRLGGSGRITITNDTTWAFEILIVARRTDADGESAAYKLTGCIDNNNNTVALVGTVTKTEIAEDTAGWDVAATADNTNKALAITVTGENGKTINWVARVTLVQVTG